MFHKQPKIICRTKSYGSTPFHQEQIEHFLPNARSDAHFTVTQGKTYTGVWREPSYVSQMNQNFLTVRSTVLPDWISFSESSAKGLQKKLQLQSL